MEDGKYVMQVLTGEGQREASCCVREDSKYRQGGERKRREGNMRKGERRNEKVKGKREGHKRKGERRIGKGKVKEKEGRE